MEKKKSILAHHNFFKWPLQIEYFVWPTIQNTDNINLHNLKLKIVAMFSFKKLKLESIFHLHLIYWLLT